MAMTSLQMDSMAEPGAPIETLARYFQSHGWNFEREGDEEIVTTVKGSWSDYELRALWREDDQVLQFICMTGINASAIRGDAETRANLFETLALVNEQLWIGHFELWSSSGIVLYRHAAMIEGEDGGTLSLEGAELLIESAIDECERFYPVFQFVLWGGKTPAEALAASLIETRGEA